MPLTLDQISEYLRKAAEQASQSTQQVSDKKLGEKVLDEIAAQSEAIQSGINKLLGKTGVITQEELDAIDEQIRKQKENILKAESKKTQRNLITYSLLAIGTIGLLWFLTKKK
jgi:hypothetical protein